MSFLDGYKTKLAGVGAILLGLSTIVTSLGTGAIHGHDLMNGGMIALGGLTALGVGGKLQKMIDAIKGAATPQ